VESLWLQRSPLWDLVLWSSKNTHLTLPSAQVFYQLLSANFLEAVDIIKRAGAEAHEVFFHVSFPITNFKPMPILWYIIVLWVESSQQQWDPRNPTWEFTCWVTAVHPQEASIAPTGLYALFFMGEPMYRERERERERESVCLCAKHERLCLCLCVQHQTACKTLTAMKPAALQSMHDAGSNNLEKLWYSGWMVIARCNCN
jgi:hypothetical protein